MSTLKKLKKKKSIAKSKFFIKIGQGIPEKSVLIGVNRKTENRTAPHRTETESRRFLKNRTEPKPRALSAKNRKIKIFNQNRSRGSGEIGTVQGLYG